MAENTENNDLKLREIFSDIKKKKYFILRIMLLSFCCGIIIALFNQKQYEARSVIVPQGTSGIKIGGSLGGLAAMAGVNLGALTGTSNSALPVDLYKNVFNNVHFKKELLQTNITLSKFPSNVTIYDYVVKPEYKRFVWFRRLKAKTINYFAVKKRKERIALRNKMMERSASTTNEVKTPEYVPLNEIEYGATVALNEIVTIAVDPKNNSVSIIARMPEAVAAAQITSATEQLLQKYIIKYKTQKAQNYLDFVEERFQEAEANYQEKREKLARFQDANKSLNTAMAQAKMTRLEEESLAAFDVYASLTSQLEQAKISVKEDTPVFMVLEPVTVPIEPVGTSKMSIIFIFVLMGTAAAFCVIVFKQYILEILQNDKLSAWFENEDKSIFSKLRKKKIVE